MPEAELQPVTLFTSGGPPSLPECPGLMGGRCASCGYVFFPMQHYGCESCGSTDLKDKLLAGRGRLVASVCVHIHAAEGRDAPFTVGSIVTEDGALVRALLDVHNSSLLRPGTVMTAHLVPEKRDGRDPYDLRFGVAVEQKA